MKKIDKKEAGNRLRRFLTERFGNLEDAAAYLDTTVSSLRNSYFNGQSLPGKAILEKLKADGCNIDWLLFGESETMVKRLGYPEYRIEAAIPAGRGELVDLSEWYQSDVLDYSPEDHVFIKVDSEFGYSMMPLIKPDDLVLISFTAPVYDGDLVAARWDRTKGALKLCSFPPNDRTMVMLSSYNSAVLPMVFKKNEIKMYKVVLIKKHGSKR
ncbi:MAG: hypothetical protein HUU54_10265 [Ignavibacteriaceae bacterium]|nr:hypothetical protein [Ignavibacteriaceae bacterium]